MAELTNLNFKVILDDADFNRRVTEDIKAAKELNAQLSALLEAKKKLNNTTSNQQAEQRAQQRTQELLRREQQRTQELLRREQNRTQEQALRGQQRLQQETNRTKLSEERVLRAKAQTLAAQNRVNNSQKTQNRLLRECATLAASYFSIHTVTSFISSLVRVSGEFELQRTTLRAILQDLDGADHIFNQLQVLAVKSPFSFQDLTSYAKQLSAFSVPMEELYDTTKMLADVSAGLGVDMSRIILAYGQIRSAAFLRGQEVRQLTEAGIPILAELAKQFSEIEGRMVSAGEVFDKISLREVPFEMVEKVFKNMTSEGGKFYNMQEVQAETLKAKVKNLGDQYQIMLYQIGQANDGVLKGAVNTIGNMMEHWQKIGRIILDVITYVGMYGVVMATVWSANKIRGMAQAVSLISRLTTHFGSLIKGVSAYNTLMVRAGKATKGAFAASIIGIVAALGVAIYQVARNAGELNRELEKIADTKLNESNTTIEGLNKIVAKLNEATKGSQNYRDAIHELNSKYGDYLPNLITEKDTLEDIALAANNAAEAIRNKAQASALSEGSEKLNEKYGKKLNASQEDIISSLTTLFPSVTNKDAANIFKLFKDLIVAGATDAESAMREAITTYLGSTPDWASVSENNGMMYKRLWSRSDDYMADYNAWDEKVRQYNEQLGVVFSDNAPLSKHEQEVVSAIDAYYTNLEQNIRQMQLSEEEVNKMLKELQIERLQNEILFYSGKGITLGDVYSYDEGVVRNDIVKQKQAELAKLTTKPMKGARLVQEALASVGVKSSGSAWGLWADETTSFTADGYYKVLDEQYTAIEPDLKRAKERFEALAGIPFDKADIEKLDEEAQAAYEEVKSYMKKRDAIIAIAENLGYDLGSVSTEKRRSNRGGSAKNPEQTAIELRIDTIKEMQSTFESLLKEGLSTDQIDALMDIYFADVNETMRRNHDYWAMLSKEADNLGQYDKTAAAKLRTDISGGQMKEKGDEEKDRLKALAESKKYLDKSDEILAKLEYTTKDVFGSGLALSIREALQEIEESNGESQDKAKEMLETIAKAKDAYVAIYGEEAWEKYKKGAEDAVDAWLKAEKAATKDVQQDRIKKLGDSFVKNFFKEKNKDISRLDQKSLSQLEDLLNLIRDELSDEDIKALIPQDLIERAAKLGITLDDIVESIKAARDEQEKVINDSFWKSLSENLDEVKSALDELGDAFSEFEGWGESVGAAFSSAGKAISLFSKGQKYFSMRDSSGSLTSEGKIGVIGTAISGAAELLSLIGNQIQENKELQEEWKQTVYETALAYREIFLDEMDYEQSNAWGVEDPFAKVNAKVQRAMAAAAELRASLSELENGQVKVGTKLVESTPNVLKGLGIGAGTGATIGGAIAGWIGAAIGAVMGGIFGAGTAQQFAQERVDVFASLKDVYGNILDQSEGAEFFALNPLLLADYENGKLDEETSALVAHWETVQEAAQEAKETIDETITDLIGEIDNDLSDALVKAFTNGDLYSALDDFHDTMTDIIEDIISRMAFAAAFGSLFDEMEAAFQGIYNPDSEYYGMSWLEILAMFEDRLDEGLDTYQKNMEEGKKWAQKKGYDVYSGEDEDTTLSSGIKSITEDTANLLASYVNAIRSDLSMMRMMQIEGWNDVKEIRALMPAPTLWEQIAKIEAHTYDMAKSNALIAQHNADMLAEMRSIITTEDGAPSIRTSAQ